MSIFRKTIHYYYNTQNVGMMISNKLPDILVTMGGMSSHSGTPIHELTEDYAKFNAMSSDLNKYYRYAKVHTPFIRTDWQINHPIIESVPTKENILKLLIDDSEALVTSFDLNKNIQDMVQQEVSRLTNNRGLVTYVNTDPKNPTLDIYNWFISSYTYKPNSEFVCNFQDKYPFVLEPIKEEGISSLFGNVQYPKSTIVVGSFINDADPMGLAILVDAREDTSQWKNLQDIKYVIVGESPAHLLEAEEHTIGYITANLKEEVELNSNGNPKIEVTTLSKKLNIASDTNISINNLDKDKLVLDTQQNLLGTLLPQVESYLYNQGLLNQTPDLINQHPLTQAQSFIKDLFTLPYVATFTNFDDLNTHKDLNSFVIYSKVHAPKDTIKGDVDSENEDDLFDESKEVIITENPSFIEEVRYSIEIKVTKDKALVLDPLGQNKINILVFFKKEKHTFKPSDKPYHVSWFSPDGLDSHSDFNIDFVSLRNTEAKRLKDLFESSTAETVMPGIKRIKYSDKTADKPINFNFLGAIVNKYGFRNTLNTSKVNKKYANACKDKVDDSKESSEDTYGDTAIPGKLDRKDTLSTKSTNKDTKRKTDRITSRKKLYNRKSYFDRVYPTNKTRYIKELADKMLIDFTANTLAPADDKLANSCYIPSCPLDTGYQGVGEYWYRFFSRIRGVITDGSKAKELTTNINHATAIYYNLIFDEALSPLMKELLLFYKEYDFNRFLQNIPSKSFFQPPYFQSRIYAQNINYFADSFINSRLKQNCPDFFKLCTLTTSSASYDITQPKDISFSPVSNYTENNRKSDLEDYVNLVGLDEFKKFIRMYYPQEYKIFETLPKDIFTYFPPELILNTLLCTFNVNLEINTKHIVSIAELLLASDTTAKKRVNHLLKNSLSPRIHRKLTEKLMKSSISLQTGHTRNNLQSNPIINNTLSWDHIAKVRVKGKIRDNYRQSGRQFDFLACSVFPEDLTYTEADLDLSQVTLKYHEPTGNTVPINIEDEEQYSKSSGSKYSICRRKVSRYPIAFICHKSDGEYLEGYAIWGLRGTIHTPYQDNTNSFYVPQSHSIVKELSVIYKKNNTRFFGSASAKKDLKPAYITKQRSGGKHISILNYVSTFTIPVDMKAFNRLSFYTREALTPRLGHMYVWAYQYKKVKKMRGWVAWAVKIIGVLVICLTWGQATPYVLAAWAALEVTGIMSKFFAWAFKSFYNLFGDSWLGTVLMVIAVMIAAYFGYGAEAAQVAVSYASYNANAILASRLSKLQSEISAERDAFANAMRYLTDAQDKKESQDSRGDAKMLMESIKDNQIMNPNTFYRLSLSNVMDFGSYDFLCGFLDSKLQLGLSGGEALDPIKSINFPVDKSFLQT